MPIVPFGLTNYRVQEKNSGLFVVQTNSGFSLFWIVMAYLLTFQNTIIMLAGFTVILFACGYRTVWTIMKTAGEVIREIKVYGIPIHKKIIKIQDIDVVLLERIPGTGNSVEYALSFSLRTEEGILFKRTNKSSILKDLLSEIKHYLPDNVKYEVESNVV